MPIIPILVMSLKGNYNVVGTVLTVSNIAPLVISTIAGILVARFGPYRFSLLASLLSAISCFILFSYQTIFILCICISIIKLCEVVINISVPAHITDITDTTDKSKIDNNLGWYSAFCELGSFIGPILSGFIVEKISYNSLWLTMGIIFFIALALLFFTTSKNTESTKTYAENNKEKKKLNFAAFRSMLNFNIILGLIASCIILFANGARTMFLPLLLKDNGFSLTMIGFLISVASLVSMVCRSRVEMFIKLVKGRANTLMLCILSLSIGLLLTPICKSFISQILVSVLVGLATGISVPTSLSIIVANIKREDVSVGLGIRILGNRIGQLANPMIFALIAEKYNMNASFIFSGLFLVGVDLLLLWVTVSNVIVKKEKMTA